MIQRPTLVLIGGGTVIDRNRILSIISAATHSLPLKKYRDMMADKGMLVDVTKGKAVKAFVLCDSNHLFLSALRADTIKTRLEDDDA